MRDIFHDLNAHEPADPMVSAQRGGQPKKIKRFYKSASVAAHDEGFAVLLDGKSVKTPARRNLSAPNRALADKIAGEWNSQGEHIDLAAMPLTRLANVAIDAVADNAAPVAQEIENYLGSDMVCYRADAPEGLIARQGEAWDGVLAVARERFGARFVLGQGVVHVAQPKEAIAAVAKHIPGDAWRLSAVSTVTTLTGSALIALALAEGAISADAAWNAAHVDEDWNMQAWGRDEMALKRRASRRAEFDAAALVLELTR